MAHRRGVKSRGRLEICAARGDARARGTTSSARRSDAVGRGRTRRERSRRGRRAERFARPRWTNRSDARISRSRGLPSYLRTEGTKVLSYELSTFEGTKVLSYEGTKVLSRTKVQVVPSYFRKYVVALRRVLSTEGNCSVCVQYCTKVQVLPYVGLLYEGNQIHTSTYCRAIIVIPSSSARRARASPPSRARASPPSRARASPPSRAASRKKKNRPCRTIATRRRRRRWT